MQKFSAKYCLEVKLLEDKYFNRFRAIMPDNILYNSRIFVRSKSNQ